MFSSNFHFPRFPAVNRFPLNFSDRNGAFGHTCARLVGTCHRLHVSPSLSPRERPERPTTPEKFENAAILIRHENAALFLPLGLPSTLIRHENGSFRKCFSNWRNLNTPSFLVWTENILNYTKLLKNDKVAIIMIFPFPSFSSTANPNQPAIIVF